MNEYAYIGDPNPDKVALLRVGAHVRRKLDANPAAERIAAEGAEIWQLHDFLSAEECARLITLVDASAKPSGVLEHGYTEVWRTSSSGDVDRNDPFIEQIEQRIDAALGLPYLWGETLQGQRYRPGEQFREHMDLFWTRADYWKIEAKRGGQRSITAMAYLNAVDEGGETAFVNIDMALKPRQGTLVVWNNNQPDGNPNRNTMHAGTPVVKGVKYVLTKWYRSRNWG